MTLEDAVAKAKQFVTAAIKGSLAIGHGARVLFTDSGD
jgi:hydroxymethylpyrimidine/phosphomethylpyrimidine kinase